MGTRRGNSSTPGNRAGRRTTHEAEAFRDDDPQGASLKPDETSLDADIEDIDGYQQHTAMFDQGELLGDLAEEFEEVVPATRAVVEAAEAPPKGCRLIVVHGPDLGTEWAFNQVEITIGRGSENDIDISDISVSRLHTRITLEGSAFYVVDLGSHNGTLLNGDPIEREKLGSGDEILIGDRTLRFVELSDAPSTDAAARQAPVGVSMEDAPPSAIIPEAEASRHAAEPVEDISDPPPPVAPPTPRRSLVVGFGGLVAVALAVVALTWMGFAAYERLAGGTMEARERLVRVRFLQAIELWRTKRCGDALVLLDRVLALEPKHPRVESYRKVCLAEIELYNRIEGAKGHAVRSQYQAALDALPRTPAASRYEEEVQSLRQLWTRRAEAKRKKAAPPPPPKAPAKRKVVPRGSPPAVLSFYDAGRFQQASAEAKRRGRLTLAKDLSLMLRLHGALESAHKAKDVSDLLNQGRQAVRVDQRISAGKGPMSREIRRYVADGLYLRALEGRAAKRYRQARRDLEEAKRLASGNERVRRALDQLRAKAQKSYARALAAEDSDPVTARRSMTEVVDLTASSDPLHRKAAKWLRNQR